MKSKTVFAIIGGVILSCLGIVIGLLTGMNVGGNHSTDFVFMGGVGYEGTGYLGALIGGVAGLLLGALVGLKVADSVDKRRVIK